ncbi:MAG: SDR family NAD(P)-dependent oxidoreductase [Oscillatoriales cyanobacterium C42_A2020_001]|nr:SDR family NAD(P)-dependent oxidoreductase [Leptolyngbyaceae cyanobacterium C42_A2020_001]
MTLLETVEVLNVLIVGASQGIGLEFVRQLLKDDQVGRVFATYRNAPSLELNEWLEHQPERLTLISMDITDEAQIAQGIAHIQQHTTQLHLVLYCVGVLHDGELQPEKSLQQIQPERLMRYFQVNSVGAVLLAKHITPLLKHRDRSVFASISAKVGSIGDNQLGGWYGYRASKAALNMFLRTVAIEYQRKSPNTVVVMLHPGTTNTRLSKPFQRGVPAEKLFPVERTVAQLLQVIHNLQPDHSGQFFSWDGSLLPW